MTRTRCARSEDRVRRRGTRRGDGALIASSTYAIRVNVCVPGVPALGARVGGVDDDSSTTTAPTAEPVVRRPQPRGPGPASGGSGGGSDPPQQRECRSWSRACARPVGPGGLRGPDELRRAALARQDARRDPARGTVDYSSVTEIRGMIAPSLTAAWPAPTLLSPWPARRTSTATRSRSPAGRRSPSAGASTAPANQRTEVISTKAAGAASARRRRRPRPPARPRPPDPLPLPSPAPTATPAPSPPAAPAPPSAIADFTTLPAASKCVRGRKLTVKFKKPPKGYVGQDRHGQGEREEGRDGQGQEAQAAAVPAQAPEGDLHRHGRRSR